MLFHAGAVKEDGSSWMIPCLSSQLCLPASVELGTAGAVYEYGSLLGGSMVLLPAGEELGPVNADQEDGFLLDGSMVLSQTLPTSTCWCRAWLCAYLLV